MVLGGFLEILAFSPFREVESDVDRTCDLWKAILVWEEANIQLAHGNFVRAELHTRIKLDHLKRSGTDHHPYAVDLLLDLAEALFGESKHNEASATKTPEGFTVNNV